MKREGRESERDALEDVVAHRAVPHSVRAGCARADHAADLRSPVGRAAEMSAESGNKREWTHGAGSTGKKSGMPRSLSSALRASYETPGWTTASRS